MHPLSERNLNVSGENEKSDTFVAFSSAGVEMYDAQDCTLIKAISGSYPVTEMSSGFLCGYPHK